MPRYREIGIQPMLFGHFIVFGEMRGRRPSVGAGGGSLPNDDEIPRMVELVEALPPAPETPPRMGAALASETPNIAQLSTL